MPRKPNYGLDKHRKEQDRKAKKDAKRMERQQRRDERSPSVIVNPPDPGKPTGLDTPRRVPPS